MVAIVQAGRIGAREEVVGLSIRAQQNLRAQNGAPHPHHRKDLVPVEIDQRAADHLLVAPDHVRAAIAPRT
jgi:hypothetical protein